MALRLIEMVLPETESEKIQELLKEHKLLEHQHIRLPDGKILMRIVLAAEQSEAVLDLLEEQYVDWKDKRIIMLPVQATLPRNEPVTNPEKIETAAKLPKRIAREELYEDIADASRCSWTYLAMAALSTIVATIGLQRNSVTIIIGAMVIAPLLGPNMALALGTILGDLSLFRRALLTSLAGIATTTALSMLIGTFVHVDPTATEISSRTQLGLSDFAAAFASGCAGSLAFTTGISAALIGVMVAVALLPPLVAFGLLVGSGQTGLGLDAFLLFLINLACVNLAGMLTFLIQGIHPVSWWEKDRAKKAIRIAISLLIMLLAILIVLILLIPLR